MKAEETRKPTTRGRPKYNIMRQRRLALGEENPVHIPLELARIIMIHRRKNWAKMYTSWKKGKGYVAWSRKWEKSKRDGKVKVDDPYYKPYLDAEHAMILCGRKAPHKRYDKEGMPLYKPTWYEEFFWFEKYCERVVDKDFRSMVRWKQRGKKPDPETIYRTAICTLVARKMLKPKGGNPHYLPLPVAIAQVWFLLFGEDEKPDSILKRMPTVGWFCAQYWVDAKLDVEKKHNSLYMLSKPLLKSYPTRLALNR